MKSFDLLKSWPAERVSAAAILPDLSIARSGPTTAPFELASLTKVLAAAAVHLAVEEGSIGLGDHAGVLRDANSDRGATVADVLAHAGGFAPDGTVLDDPRRKRIYSNGGYDLLAQLVANATGMAFDQYLHLGVFEPLAMDSSELVGSAAYAGRSTVDDLVKFLAGIGWLLDASTIQQMTTPHLPGLDGVLPGFGRQTQNLWGLGPEIRGTKSPHWTGSTNSPRTWGHFGQAGTFFWQDPDAELSVIVLTNRPFGDWAAECWPRFSDAVREEALMA